MNYRLVASLALTSALGSMACGGSDKPAQDPSTVASTQTTAAQTTDDTSAPPPSTDSTTATAPSDSSGTTPSTGNYSSNYGKPGTTASMRTTTAGATNTYPSTPPSTAQATPTPANGAPVAQNPGVADQTKNADNTKINDRDRHGALTPMDQGGSDGERKITQAIRKGVVADKSLSFTAKNVKIITVGGKVTLRGPVKTDAERASIESQARNTPLVTDVDNQLEVKK